MMDMMQGLFLSSSHAAVTVKARRGRDVMGSTVGVTVVERMVVVAGDVDVTAGCRLDVCGCRMTAGRV